MPTAMEFESDHAQVSAKRSAFIICIIVISESLLATVLFPFVYQMVKDLDGVEERDIGYWAGLISTCLLPSYEISC